MAPPPPSPPPPSPPPAPAPPSSRWDTPVPQWVILWRVPRVYPADVPSKGSEFSLALAAPPRISSLSLAAPPHLSSAYLTAAPPQISANGRFLSGDLGPFAPFVLAADASGVILVHAYSARVLFDHSGSGSNSGSGSGSGGPFVAGDKGGSRIGPCLYVIDTFSAAADFLPDRNTNPGLTNFALVVHNHEGVVARSYSVMELVLEADSNKAQLWEFSSASGVWSTKTLTCPIHLPWNSNISFVF